MTDDWDSRRSALIKTLIQDYDALFDPYSDIVDSISEMVSVSVRIDEIWVHKACTTRPGQDTIWMTFAVRQPGRETQYAKKRYEIKMRVKRNPNEPYRRVFEAVFDVEAEPETRFSYLLTNCSKPHGEAEAHIEGLIDKFDATNDGLFDQDQDPHGRHPALQLVGIIGRNLATFNVVGAVVDIGAYVSRTFFTNMDAPVAYGRVIKLHAADLVGEERYARDHLGHNSKYGVAFKVRPA